VTFWNSSSVRPRSQDRPPKPRSFIRISLAVSIDVDTWVGAAIFGFVLLSQSPRRVLLGESESDSGSSRDPVTAPSGSFSPRKVVLGLKVSSNHVATRPRNRHFPRRILLGPGDSTQEVRSSSEFLERLADESWTDGRCPLQVPLFLNAANC